MIQNTNSIFKRFSAPNTQSSETCARPSPNLNIFDGIPPDWVADKGLIFRGKSLLNELPSELRHLFNAVFSDEERFKRFCTCPSSIRGHHADVNGNLRHTLETAEGIKIPKILQPYTGFDMI